MAATIDMFAAGGEGLGGLFVGNQMAMQRDAAEVERQRAMVDMANTQQIMRQRELGNQFEEAVLPEKIAGFKEGAAAKRETAAAERFTRTGEQFGRLGSMLEGVPPAARNAALRQMAGQAGIGDDNPLLQSLMSVDPNELPGALNKIGEGFYQQSTAGRAETLKASERRQTEREKSEAAAERAREANETRKAIAQMSADARRDAAGIAASASRANTAQRAGSRAGAGGVALSTDKAIANLIMNDPDLAPDEKLEALQRYNLSKATVGKSDTASQVMGTPSGSQRVEEAIRGQGKSTPKGKTQFQEGKVYQDASGNKARFENGKWVPVGASAVPN